MAIFRNDVTVLGVVTKNKFFQKKSVTRLVLDVPFTKRDGEKGSHSIEIDMKGDRANEAKSVEVGETVFAKAIMVKAKCSPDGVDGSRYVMRLQLDDYKGFRRIPGAVQEGFIEVVLAGRVMKTPELRSSGDKQFCFLETVFNRPGASDEKGTFIDVGVFGASAEKFVTKYIKEGDFVLVEGSLAPRKEDFKIKGLEVWGLRLNSAPFAGVQSVTPIKGSGGGGGGVAAADPDMYDDDLPF